MELVSMLSVFLGQIVSSIIGSSKPHPGQFPVSISSCIKQLAHEPSLHMYSIKLQLYKSRLICPLMDIIMNSTVFVFCSNEVFCTLAEKDCVIQACEWAEGVRFSVRLCGLVMAECLGLGFGSMRLI